MKKLVIVFCAAAVLASCKVEKEKSGELPDVDVDMDVDADAGSLPEFDVDWAEVNVGTTTKMVKVPKIVVVMEEEEVEVPVIDVDMPGDKMERTLMVEAEVSGNEHAIDIQEIRANNNKLYVISTIEEMETSLGDKTLRIQDQVELNAPDLDVKHIIVGTKADRVFNNNYTYVSNMGDVDAMTENAKVIYKK
ncbi:hypothetical protein FGM00_15785 [Aggregatimonas sangjinii]|uniref:Uncharacterized protein n=1 Tax=Aggregatimonas sangjinii TaxID=2583587 RepID=A0A5B7SS11_9FLAO|nr:hypothetical protein [Aggregatimonas sangjinii]QCX01495.1 hypothetical protein FGM00_15785 [Aggregatimonas sangjinii]